jgi:hypothetical protein
MGTNYYLYPASPCEACGRPYGPKHIGKSSGGWCFSLHVIPEEGINDLEDWEKLWNQEGAVIEDEYGIRINKILMEKIITIRDSLPIQSRKSDRWFVKNSAVPGPNGLVRSRIDMIHCIGHGKGTWDLIIGEFS